MMKIFRKERLPNGRRHIYLFGIKILSYKHKHHVKQIITDINVKYVSADRLPIFLRDKFYTRTGKLPTENLETLNEKVIWASMFDVTPLKIQCADKYAVREYIEKTIGEKYLPKIYAVYKSPDEFNMDDLPDSFVLTFNAGSGQNTLVRDKTSKNESELKNTIRSWLMYNHSEPFCEMQYRYIPPRVIARELVDIREDIEYKLFCFGGRVEFIKLISYKYGHSKIGSCHFDRDWNRLPFYSSGGDRYCLTEPFDKPAFFDELIEIAEKLAKPFDFVRVDFYETKDGKLVFGELTFSPTAGYLSFAPDNDTIQKQLGKLFKMPKRDENGFAVH